MGFIYKITNEINDKIYVGYTKCPSINDRWATHIKALNRGKETYLYNAMRKYGINNFHIEEIEECPNDIIEEREIYWIDKLKSYETGYNLTRGGDGGRTATTEKLQEMHGIPVFQYDINGNYIDEYISSGAAAQATNTCQSEIVRCLNHSRGALTANNSFWVYEEDIPLIPEFVIRNKTKYGNKYLIQKDIETGNVINIYLSVAEAARQLNVCRTNFFRILKKERPIGYGYLWEQVNNNETSCNQG